MSNHFEDVWLEAETVAAKDYSSDYALELIHNHADVIRELIARGASPQDLSDEMGGLLMCIATISKNHDINVWGSMVDATNDFRSSQMAD